MDGLRGEGEGGGERTLPAEGGLPAGHRVRLFAAAYRMLGSASAAEEVVRDAFAATTHASAREPGRNRADRLVREVFGAVLHRVEVARPRREAHPGPWLPEPVLTADGTLGPLGTSALRESVSMPRLVLLERLPTGERACRVLREVFGYGPAESAAVLGLPEARCAALERRARQRLRESEGAERTAADEARRRPAAEELLRAVSEADQPALEELLADDVVAWSDGGGSEVARRPVLGAAKVGRFLAGLPTRIPEGTRGRLAEVNGDPALVASAGAALVGVLVPEFGPQGLIVGIRTVSDPARLAFLGRQWATSPGAAESG